MKICIIGGSGNFGQFFTKLFKAQKHKVFSLGRDNVKKFDTLIEKSEIIIMAVPADAAKTYYEKLSKVV